MKTTTGVKAGLESGRCVYSYFGGSYITIPPEESRKN
jgi:hypothetical protein